LLEEIAALKKRVMALELDRLSSSHILGKAYWET